MTAAARLDLRLTSADKKRIETAARLRGLPISSFIRSAVLSEAEQTLATEFELRLSPAESRRLVAALSKPFAPNAALRKAMARGNKLGL